MTYDPAHARQRALKQATELRDSLHARYRTCSFTIHTTVLVRAADCTVTRQQSMAGGVSVASPLTEEPVTVLRESLRYAGEARDRSMPVASVMSAWISLERLAKGARRRDRDRTDGPRQSPGTFLPKRLGSLMGLVAMRSVWSVSWHLAQMAGRESDRAEDWKAIEQHLGVRGSFVNLGAWAKLLTNESASPRDRRHAELLADLVEGFPTLARVRLLVARDMLLRGQAFVDWVNPLIAVAHAHIDRLVLLRHRAVHEAVADAAGARELQQVGLFALDATFQVLPRWLEDPHVAGEPWKALDEIYGWRRRVMADWKRHRRPVDSDPERILTR